MVTKRIGRLSLLFLPYVFSYNLFRGTLLRALSVFEQSILNSVIQSISSPDVFHAFSVMWPQTALPTLVARFSRLFRTHSYEIFVDWNDLWGRGGMLSQFDADARSLLVAPRLISPMIQFLEEKIPKYADAVTVTNETIRRHALEVGLRYEDLFVIPNGADVSFFQPIDMMDARASLGLPRNLFIFTYANSSAYSLDVVKLLLSAHQKITKSHADCTLLLIGTLRTSEARLLEDTSIRNVLYVGQQPYDNYRLYLAASNALVLPIGCSAYDSARSPIRLGDYLATGRPIVAAALPQLTNIIDGCGLLAKPGDPNDFAEKMIALKNDSVLRHRLGKMARHKAETEYSWNMIASQLEKIYRREQG
jgi:glycosyltransferase involved in cell wall biosynthesis